MLILFLCAHRNRITMEKKSPIGRQRVYTDFFFSGMLRNLKADFDIKCTFFQNENEKPWILQVTHLVIYDSSSWFPGKFAFCCKIP